MDKKAIPVISIIGRSNSGKTTFIEKLIPILGGRGIRVATIKHHLHDFESDRKGKDSYRHKQAGARISMIVSPRKVALTADIDRELTPAEIISTYIRDVELVIVEGLKKAPGPKIEVYRYAEGLDPLSRDDREVIALVTDVPVDAAIPVFSRDVPEPVAELIIDRLGIQSRAE